MKSRSIQLPAKRNVFGIVFILTFSFAMNSHAITKNSDAKDASAKTNASCPGELAANQSGAVNIYEAPNVSFTYGNRSNRSQYVFVNKVATTSRYILIGGGADGLTVLNRRTGGILARKTYTETQSFGHPIGADVNGISSDKNYIYLAASGAGVIILDAQTLTPVKSLKPLEPHFYSVQDPTQLNEGGALELNGVKRLSRFYARDVRVQDGLAYVIGAQLQVGDKVAPLIEVLDVKTGQMKKLITLPRADWQAYSMSISGLAISNNKLYFSYASNGVVEYDLDTNQFHNFAKVQASAPNVGSVRVPEMPRAIAVKGNLLYVSDDYLGVAVFNRNTRRLLYYIQSKDLQPDRLWATGVSIYGNNLYVANAGAGGLATVDLSRLKPTSKSVATLINH